MYSLWSHLPRQEMFALPNMQKNININICQTVPHTHAHTHSDVGHTESPQQHGYTSISTGIRSPEQLSLGRVVDIQNLLEQHGDFHFLPVCRPLHH